MPQKLIPAELAAINTLRLEAGSSVSFFAVCYGRCAALASKARNPNMDGLEICSCTKNRTEGMSRYASPRVDSHAEYVVLGLDLGRERCGQGSVPGDCL